MRVDPVTTVRAGLRQFTSNWRTAVRLSIGPLFGCFLTVAMMWVLHYAAWRNNFEFDWWMTNVFHLTWTSLYWAPVSVLLVNLVRLRARGDLAPRRPLGIGWGPRESAVYVRLLVTQLVIFLLALLVFAVVVALTAIIFSSAHVIVSYASTLSAVLSYFAMTTSILIFVLSSALDEPVGVKPALRMMQKHFFKVFGFTCVVYVPLYLLFWFATSSSSAVKPIIYWAEIVVMNFVWGAILLPVLFVFTEFYLHIRANSIAQKRSEARSA